MENGALLEEAESVPLQLSNNINEMISGARFQARARAIIICAGAEKCCDAISAAD
jgi:hypothetical protein